MKHASILLMSSAIGLAACDASDTSRLPEELRTGQSETQTQSLEQASAAPAPNPQSQLSFGEVQRCQRIARFAQGAPNALQTSLDSRTLTEIEVKARSLALRRGEAAGMSPSAVTNEYYNVFISAKRDEDKRALLYELENICAPALR